MTELQIDTARTAGWVFVHARATDTVTFGPFEDYNDLKMWLETIGDAEGIRGVAVPLVNPASDPDLFWDPLYKLVNTAEVNG